jgi:uncharacterized protein (TIGR02611 family)
LILANEKMTKNFAKLRTHLPHWFKTNWKKLPHPFRWVIVATVGFTLVVTGIIFMVLPGPGIPILITGLAILATEFTWAEIVLNKTKHHFSKALKRIRK